MGSSIRPKTSCFFTVLKALNGNQREGVRAAIFNSHHTEAIEQRIETRTTNEAVIFGRERNRRSVDEEFPMTETAMFSKIIGRSIRGKGLEAKWRVVWATEKHGHEQKGIFSGTNSLRCVDKPSKP